MHRRNFSRLALAGVSGLLMWPANGTAASPTQGTVRGKVTVSKRRGKRKPKPKRTHSGVVVYLEGVAEARLPKPTVPHEITQKNQQFEPAVSVVVVGTKISFPNDDRIYHNVYSLSDVLEFDLGQYKAGTTKIIKVSKPGHMEVYCNIHPGMRATVLVLDTTFYAETDPDGTFVINNVPPGTYTYVAWQPDGSPVRGEVVVVAGGENVLDIPVVEDPRAPRQLDKHGKPHGRYK